MNNLEHILHKLRTIEPDQRYTDRSLNAIIGSPRNSKRWLSLTLLHIAEYGSAVALVSLLFLVMLGNSSLNSLFSPIQSGSLNSGGLRAEAEAIDIQIKLLDVDYIESSSTLPTSNTSRIAKKKSLRTAIIAPKQSTSTPQAETSTPPTIEDVLELLSE